MCKINLPWNCRRFCIVIVVNTNFQYTLLTNIVIVRKGLHDESSPPCHPLANRPASKNFFPFSVNSPQSCINEWHTMADVLVRRPPSPHRTPKIQRLNKFEANTDFQVVIRNRLRQIMNSCNLGMKSFTDDSIFRAYRTK